MNRPPWSFTTQVEAVCVRPFFQQNRLYSWQKLERTEVVLSIWLVRPTPYFAFAFVNVFFNVFAVQSLSVIVVFFQFRSRVTNVVGPANSWFCLLWPPLPDSLFDCILTQRITYAFFAEETRVIFSLYAWLYAFHFSRSLMKWVTLFGSQSICILCYFLCVFAVTELSRSLWGRLAWDRDVFPGWD